MKTSIATISVSGNLLEKLEAISAAGFDGIEIFEQDFIAHDGGPREVGQMVRDQGLEIFLFQPFRDFEGLPEPDRSRALLRAEQKFDIMAELGCNRILVCSSVHPKALGGIDRMAEDFRALGELAAPRGIQVGFEALAWGRYVNDHRDAWEVVRRADHPNIGLILDSFHTLGRKLDPDSIRRIPGDRITFVQLADAPDIEMDLLYWSRHFRNMPGEGDLPVTRFMQAVAATGYDGPISLEIFNDQFRSGNPRRTARDGHRSLLNLMDRVARQEPGLPTPAIPDRARVRGVEFVEFAARGSEAAALGQLLASMGFAWAGRHRNKDVEVWQQAGIRIVINRETVGFPNTFWLSHGIGVCDIGLRVEDAAAAVARARAMDAEVFHQLVGPGELEIPAIRSIGASIMHFIDEDSGLSKVWEIEFDPSAATPPQGAVLTRIDHIAETMPFDEMLSWSLFYGSIFEMDKAPMIDVIDPDGLVRSQAVAAPDRCFRLTLNGAETHRTLAGHFLADSFGSSVQHIAFATDDIFKAAAAMADLGFSPLPIPENYYRDLEARFPLPQELLERMRRFDILYDQDKNGAFFQFYSRPWKDGFFLEVLQRQRAYDGYGAANAPFRIAAQKRLVRSKYVPRI